MRSFIFGTLFLTFFFTFDSANAAVFDVDTTVDGTAFTACTAAANDCSLRGAIMNANATPEADTINVPTGNYTLTAAGGNENAGVTGDLDISSDVSIIGAGASTTVVDGNDIDRVFEILNVGGSGTRTVTLSGLTIRNGTAPTPTTTEVGGGISVRSVNNTSTGTTTLNIFDCIVSDNLTTSSNGGGIAVTKNATGAAPVLNIERSTIANNATTGGNNGGAIVSTGAQVNITDSTLSGNVATGTSGGGAIFVTGNGALTNVTNSTISGNSAAGAGAIGGGIRLALGNGIINLLNATIADNTAATGAGGVNNATGTLNATNSIIANNSGTNIDGANGLNGTDTTNITANFAGLLPLGDNGGPTQTHAIPTTVGPGLPKDAGTNAAAVSLTYDQRGPGSIRVSNTTIDIGAFESQAATAADISISGRVTNAWGQGIARVRVIIIGGNGEVRQTLTGPFGYYRFDNVKAGQSYVLRAEAKRYRFEQRFINAFDDFTDVDFSALP